MDLRSKSRGRDVRDPSSIERTLQPSASRLHPSVSRVSNSTGTRERNRESDVGGQNGGHSEANGPAARTPIRPTQLRPLTSPLTPLEGAEESPFAPARFKQVPNPQIPISDQIHPPLPAANQYIPPAVNQPATSRGPVPVIVTTTEPRVPATRPAPSPAEASSKRPRKSKQSPAKKAHTPTLSPGTVDNVMREANPIFPTARAPRAPHTPRQPRRSNRPENRRSPAPDRAPSAAPSISETERGFEQPHVLTMTDNQLENLLRSFGTNVSRQGEQTF
ncbi:hypothetical protein C0992_011807 [Termitomyces sp. T32_za158]|nr:hypothetical protein C0992_011807 [Termitomyces sp. T32_za158]